MHLAATTLLLLLGLSTNRNGLASSWLNVATRRFKSLVGYDTIDFYIRLLINMDHMRSSCLFTCQNTLECQFYVAGIQSRSFNE